MLPPFDHILFNQFRRPRDFYSNGERIIIDEYVINRMQLRFTLIVIFLPHGKISRASALKMKFENLVEKESCISFQVNA